MYKVRKGTLFLPNLSPMLACKYYFCLLYDYHKVIGSVANAYQKAAERQ